MIGSICVVHLAGGEVVVGRVELRGIYEPAYGMWVVGDHGERAINWMDIESLLRVGSRVEQGKLEGVQVVIPASASPPADLNNAPGDAIYSDKASTG